MIPSSKASMPTVSLTTTSKTRGSRTRRASAHTTSTRSPTPFSRARRSITGWSTGSRSSATTRRAPRRAATTAQIPLPAPMSRTVWPGRTRAASARWKARLRRVSASSAWWKESVPISCEGEIFPAISPRTPRP